MNARDASVLSQYSSVLRPFLSGRIEALTSYASSQDTATVKVSAKTRAFWEEKKLAAEKLLGAIDAEGKEREEYYENSKAAWEVGLGAVLNKLSAEVVGPFTLGEWTWFHFSMRDVDHDVRDDELGIGHPTTSAGSCYSTRHPILISV